MKSYAYEVSLNFCGLLEAENEEELRTMIKEQFADNYSIDVQDCEIEVSE